MQLGQAKEILSFLLAQPEAFIRNLDPRVNENGLASSGYYGYSNFLFAQKDGQEKVM